MGVERQIERAAQLFEQAYAAQMRGDLERAERLYKESLLAHPTAEAHTFLGWTYSFRGDLEAAIAECRRAIAIDPAFGNPYNDIGAYLMELGRLEEAIAWLEKAKGAARYEAPHYPRFNLGRIYLAQELYNRALGEFEEALAVHPGYEPAQQAIAAVKRRLN